MVWKFPEIVSGDSRTDFLIEKQKRTLAKPIFSMKNRRKPEQNRYWQWKPKKIWAKQTFSIKNRRKPEQNLSFRRKTEENLSKTNIFDKTKTLVGGVFLSTGVSKTPQLFCLFLFVGCFPDVFVVVLLFSLKMLVLLRFSSVFRWAYWFCSGFLWYFVENVCFAKVFFCFSWKMLVLLWFSSVFHRKC